MSYLDFLCRTSEGLDQTTWHRRKLSLLRSFYHRYANKTAKMAWMIQVVVEDYPDWSDQRAVTSGESASGFSNESVLVPILQEADHYLALLKPIYEQHKPGINEHFSRIERYNDRIVQAWGVGAYEILDARWYDIEKPFGRTHMEWLAKLSESTDLGSGRAALQRWVELSDDLHLTLSATKAALKQCRPSNEPFPRGPKPKPKQAHTSGSLPVVSTHGLCVHQRPALTYGRIELTAGRTQGPKR